MSRSPTLALAVLLASCGPSPRTITIDLDARVGDAPFDCRSTFEGVGTTATSLTLEDFRLYVHDVRVVTETGEVALDLDEDGVWQSDGVAMLDFEAGDPCGGNEVTNSRLIGTIPGDAGTITGLRFRLGVPADRNHLDSATAPSPLNLSSMFWGWQAGYKYLRIEGRTTGQPAGFAFHLGAMECSGEASMGTRVCARPNIADVSLTDFDPARDVIVADLGALFSLSDLDNDASSPPGCMSDLDDSDCVPLLDALGIGPGAAEQRMFRVSSRPTR